MTREDFAMIVKGMRAVYAQPTFIADKDAFDVWYELFGNYPYEVVSAAAKAHMVSNTKIPTPADINIQIVKLRKGNSDSLPSAEEAWAMVRKAVSRSYYYSESEFYKLPEIVQDAVGTHENLWAWAVMDIDEFETVQKSHFTRSYNGRVDRAKADEKLPKPIRSAVEAARANPEIEQYRMPKIESKTLYDKARERYENPEKPISDSEDFFLKILKERYIGPEEEKLDKQEENVV